MSLQRKRGRKMPIPEKMLQQLRQAQRILLIAHVSPDGDTLGSALALRLAFLSLEKTADVVCEDPVPRLYMHLPGAEKVLRPEAVRETTYDLAMAVDVSDEGRMGRCEPLFFSVPQRLLIDHHGTNTHFGQENWVDAEASATGAMALLMIHALNVPLTREIARCLFVALSTDTGHFQFANTNAQALRAAAECVETGIDVAVLTERLYRQKPRAKTELMACALGSLKFERVGRIAYMTLCAADFARCEASEDMSEGIISFAIETQGVQVAFLAREKADGIKFSLRSKPPYDVAKICKGFGGGGHILAAGCTIAGSMESAVAAMLSAIDVG